MQAGIRPQVTLPGSGAVRDIAKVEAPVGAAQEVERRAFWKQTGMITAAIVTGWVLIGSWIFLFVICVNGLRALVMGDR